MNGMTHGMRANEHAVLPHEDQREIAGHIEMWLRDLGGETEAELEVGKSIALLRWRLRRIDEVESSRQQAEVLHRLDETLEKQTLDTMKNTLAALGAMCAAMESRLPACRQELDQLLEPMAAVMKMLVQVEDSEPDVLVGAAELAIAIENLKAHSVETVSPLGYGEVISRAHSSADAVRAHIPDVEKMVELKKIELATEIPLPSDRDVALRVRYRRDIERRLEAELKFLMLLRERRAQVEAPGSLGGLPATQLRPAP